MVNALQNTLAHLRCSDERAASSSAIRALETRENSEAATAIQTVRCGRSELRAATA
jgi:hypothetical protein